MLIFLVDADDERQELLRLGLKMAGYQVRTASANVEALGCLVQNLIGQEIVELILPRNRELGLARRIVIQQSGSDQELAVVTAAFGYFPLPRCSCLRQADRNTAFCSTFFDNRFNSLLRRLFTPGRLEFNTSNRKSDRNAADAIEPASSHRINALYSI